MSERWTVGTVLTAANEYLSGRDIPGARLEAELLLAHSLALSRFDLYTQFDRPLSEEERTVYRRLLTERSTGRPLQHLTGTQAFRRLDLRMANDVFIPRPETELLVEKVLEWISGREDAATALEIGTGSGAVCVSLAVEAPRTTVWSTDISQEALALAAVNARAHGVEDRVHLVRGDFFSSAPAGQTFDVIVSNPPYIPSGEIDSLASEVRDHEPRAALDGGPAGLDFYRRIISEGGRWLEAGGLLAFEVGIGQAQEVAAGLSTAGFEGIDITCDYGGIERIVTAVHRSV